MNIIICGTGQVGTSIAGYLALDNQVTIIDADAERVQRAADMHNLRGVIGVSSHPDILEQAGAKDADMIISVTNPMRSTWCPVRWRIPSSIRR